jgi:hypothetical protein
VAALRAALDEESFAAAWAAGSSKEFEDALDEIERERRA